MIDPVQWGAELKAMFEAPAFKDVVMTVDKAIQKRWEEAVTTPDREACWYELEGLRKVLKEMRIVVDRGLQAAKSRGAAEG